MEILLLLTTLVSLLLVDHFVVMSVVLLVELTISGVLKYFKKNEFSSMQKKIYGMQILGAVVGIMWLIFRSYWMILSLQIIILLSSVIYLTVCSVGKYKRWKDVKSLKRTVIIIQTFLLVMGIVASILLTSVAINPNNFLRFLRSTNSSENTMIANPKEAKLWNGGYYLTSDVSYDSKYPNNKFDIYTSEEKFTDKHPVYIYVHGGGYFAGDKSSGDPNAGGMDGLYEMFEHLLDRGFTIISVNYALSPEYNYPTPMYQMMELVSYLKAYKEQYGLDMTQITLGGGSAGGHIVGQFAAIQTNANYATEMGISQVLTGGEIKAIYFGCALLDNERFAHTGSVADDYFFYQMGRGYFDTGFLKGNKIVQQSNVISHVTEDYPPCYITDGNVGTFNEQAHDLVRRLKRLSVTCVDAIYDGENSRGTLPHGYEHLGGKVAMENAAAMAEFLSSYVNFE